MAVAAVGLIIFNPSASQAQSKGPIKIGYIAPLTGAFAENGKDMTNGTIHPYIEEKGIPANYQICSADDLIQMREGILKK